MTTPPAVHNHQPIWIAGSIRATCRDHYWQPLANTGTPNPAGAR